MDPIHRLSGITENLVSGTSSLDGIGASSFEDKQDWFTSLNGGADIGPLTADPSGLEFASIDEITLNVITCLGTVQTG